MVPKRTQRPIFTITLYTPVHALVVCRTSPVVAQRLRGTESLATPALIVSLPTQSLRISIYKALLPNLIRDDWISHDVFSIEEKNVSIDGIATSTRGTAAGLDMSGNSRGR